MAGKKFSGVYAALLTPRKANDSVDIAALARLIRFLLSTGISSFSLNGATGEFYIARPEHLRTMLETVREVSEGKAEILCGIGAPSISLVREFAAVAEKGGASGLLLPMPYFFRYEQQDLDAFCREAAKHTDLPILLYNLPQFSSGLDKDTVFGLIEEVPNIIGIKDSGGSLDILRDLTDRAGHACRFVGNDPTLRPALSEGVCDGIISGIACVLPELILALYLQNHRAAYAEFDESWRFLREIVRQLDGLPTPWALKWIAEARDILPAEFGQPLSEERLAHGIRIKAWFREWFPAAVPGGKMTW